MKNQLSAHEANLLKFDQQRFVTGELEADSYNRLKRHTQDQIEKLKRDMEDLNLTDTAFEKYSRYGISLLTHMDIYFQMASLEVKRKMLGSIFPGKLIYQDGKYRTEGMNPALELILQKTSGLQNEKTGNIVISENVSGDVPTTGLRAFPPVRRRAPHFSSGRKPNFWLSSRQKKERSCDLSFILPMPGQL